HVLQGPVCTNLGLKPGQRLTVKGKIGPNAKRGLQKDSVPWVEEEKGLTPAALPVSHHLRNIADTGRGLRKLSLTFPFALQITFSVNQNDVTVHLPGHQFTFPNRLNLSVFDYFDTQGDFTLQSLSWE
ncbi:LEG4 protein, partial [Leptocoma aspasia]|nr:LEG4 protein [Leptocoma aspasia]